MPHRCLSALLLVSWLLSAARADEPSGRPAVVRLPPVGVSEPEGVPASGPDTEAEGAAPPDANAPPPTPAPPDYLPVFLFPAYTEMAAWTGSIELGLNGSTGNSETFDFRFGLDAERKWDIHRIDVDLDYVRKTAGGVETAHRSLLDWRYERLFRDTRWTWFVHGTFEYDEFEAWDSRVTADTGLGYHLIATDSTKLVSRAGGGFARTIGLPDDRWVPELVFGLEFEHKIGNRHRLKAKVDYMPEVTDFARFRIHSQASWEMLIDEAMNLSLKLGALNRHDSSPRDARRNDLDYNAVVLWRF